MWTGLLRNLSLLNVLWKNQSTLKRLQKSLFLSRRQWRRRQATANATIWSALFDNSFMHFTQFTNHFYISKITSRPVANICSNSGVPYLSRVTVFVFWNTVGLGPNGLGCDMRLFFSCIGKIYTRGSETLKGFCWFLKNSTRAIEAFSHWLCSHFMNLSFLQESWDFVDLAILATFLLSSKWILLESGIGI